jgi:ubiquitin
MNVYASVSEECLKSGAAVNDEAGADELSRLRREELIDRLRTLEGEKSRLQALLCEFLSNNEELRCVLRSMKCSG